MKKCIGSGFCCIMEQCQASLKLHGEVEMCPELVFKDGRYWCKLVETKPELIKDMMGIGCGAPWNKWRKDVKKRSRKDYMKYLNGDMAKDLTTGM